MTVRPGGTSPPLPGAIGVSQLSVYDWPSADGVCGGSAHLHLTCTEAYVVVSGRGAVQTLASGGFQVTPLEPGAVVWFTPGTIHRLVNDDDLRIVVLMQNAGLPESGDAVFTFPPAVLADPAAYAAAAALDPADPESAARRRRDLAIEGFTALRERASHDPAAVADFHRAAVALKAPLVEKWRAKWKAGASSAAAETERQLDRLAAGDPGYLSEAGVYRSEPVAAYGMCGRLDTYPT